MIENRLFQIGHNLNLALMFGESRKDDRTNPIRSLDQLENLMREYDQCLSQAKAFELFYGIPETGLNPIREDKELAKKCEYIRGFHTK